MVKISAPFAFAWSCRVPAFSPFCRARYNRAPLLLVIVVAVPVVVGLPESTIVAPLSIASPELQPNLSLFFRFVKYIIAGSTRLGFTAKPSRCSGIFRGTGHAPSCARSSLSADVAATIAASALDGILPFHTDQKRCDRTFHHAHVRQCDWRFHG